MATTKATTLAHTLGGIAGSIETAEINRLDGVNADIQTQLNDKAPTASPQFTGNITGTGAEGTSASLYLIADEGDDNGDGWRINSNQDVNDLTISNNTSGSYADKLTITSAGKVGIGGSPTSALVTGTASGSDNANVYLGATGTGNAEIVLDASNGDFAGSDYYMLRQMNSLDVENWLGVSGDYIWKTAGGTERTRLKSNGMTVHNGMYSYVRTFYQSLSSTVYYEFDIDNSVQYFYIKAMIGYYPGSAYTATYHVYAAFRSDSGIGVVNTLLNQTHSNSGSWSLSDDGLDTITVTKTGGNSTAMAKGFIEVQWRDAT